MGKKAVVVMPKTKKALIQLGENIRLARLRRKLSVELVAERAGISRSTVWTIEKGAPSVSMGAYAAVLLAVGLHDDLLKVGADDQLGRTLQDLSIQPKKRAPKTPQSDAGGSA
jgi:transcriptional regulator with XRE-family HTH domain